MNWNQTHDGTSAEVALAIIKRPAKVPVTDVRYAGMILLNPGGPGGSGVDFLLKYGEKIQTILDHGNTTTLDQEPERYFDLLSWDPRGVNNTTPHHPSLKNKEQWLIETKAIGVSLDDAEVFSKIWARARLYAGIISSPSASADVPHIGQFASTANVVRDMVHMIERHGQWREQEAARIFSKQRDARASAKRAVLDRTRWHKDQELLQYWGFSYGTIIGQTFASMYPDRVGRLVLDGVANASDYTATSWASGLRDTDAIVANFTAECAAAGTEACPIARWAPGNATRLRQALDEYLESLKREPVTSAAAGVPTIVTYSDVVSELWGFWYNGFEGFKNASQLLWTLSQGNTSHFAAQQPAITCPAPDGPPHHDHAAAAMGILCTDGNSLLNQTRDDFQAYVRQLRRLTRHFTDGWALNTLACSNYRLRPAWRFTGPYGARPRRGILFVSQTLDPVTPLQNARDATALFPGSQVVEAQGVGHCSLGFPNLYAMKEIRRYLRTGVVPAEPRVCPPSVKLFGEGRAGEISLEDRILVDAIIEIGRTWPK